jgi:hypothetical protein
MFRAAVLVAVILQVGCDDVRQACPGRRCFSAETRFTYAEPHASEVDIVVVMDDSPSMAAKQARALETLRKAFERTFAAIPGFDLDLQIQVISSTLPGEPRTPGCGAAHAADCALPPGGVLMTSPVCGAKPNFEGSAGAAIACAARFPATGCAVEQPLAALRAHLEHAPTRRPGGFLFVLIITDEDDCSSDEPLSFDRSDMDGPESSQRCRDADAAGALTPVNSYVSFLHAFGGGRPPSVAVVAPGRSCGVGTDADTPLLIGLPCLPGRLADHDAALPGVQPDCVVTQHAPSEPPRTLPPCPVGDGICWRPEKRLECGDSGYALAIDHRTCVSPPGSWLEITCATKP